MARNDSIEMGELTDTSYYILLSLVEARHGYLIMQTIETMTNGRVTIGPASMYTTIKKLVAADLIRHADGGTDKRKTYMATEKGIQLLQSEMERRREMVIHGEEMLKKREAAES